MITGQPTRTSVPLLTPACATTYSGSTTYGSGTILLADRFHHRDHLGSLRVAFDERGWVTARHDFYPFGREMRPGAVESARLFTGHERDAGSELDYMLARFGSSAVGRFLACDRFPDITNDIPSSWNAYSYVRNNPLVLIDPSGNWADPAVWKEYRVSFLGRVGLFLLGAPANGKGTLSAGLAIKDAVGAPARVPGMYNPIAPPAGAVYEAFSNIAIDEGLRTALIQDYADAAKPGPDGGVFGAVQWSGGGPLLGVPAGTYWWFVSADGTQVWVWRYSADASEGIVLAHPPGSTEPPVCPECTDTDASAAENGEREKVWPHHTQVPTENHSDWDLCLHGGASCH